MTVRMKYLRSMIIGLLAGIGVGQLQRVLPMKIFLAILTLLILFAMGRMIVLLVKLNECRKEILKNAGRLKHIKKSENARNN